jgi:hypothetical protein
MNPAIIIQSLARSIYNGSPEPLGHFSDTRLTEDEKRAMLKVTERIEEEDAAANVQLMKWGMVIVFISIISAIVIFR